MTLGKIVQEGEHPNFVIFENLLGRRVLYDRIFNSFHDAEDASVNTVISALKKIKSNSLFGIDYSAVRNQLRDEPIEQLIYDLT